MQCVCIYINIYIYTEQKLMEKPEKEPINYKQSFRVMRNFLSFQCFL